MSDLNQLSSMSNKRNIKEILPAELSGKLRSKLDFYIYLDKHLQYYLPPAGQVNKDFLKQIFTNEKKLKKKKEVDYIHVSHFQELSVKNLWTELKEDVDFKIYFQDTYPNEKGPCRSYFFDILNTIYPDYLKQIMKHATSERFSATGVNQQENVIKVTDEWFSELESMLFLSRKFSPNLFPNPHMNIEKKGKTLHLLKASSKKINPHKKRKVIPLLGRFSEFQKSNEEQRKKSLVKEQKKDNQGNVIMQSKAPYDPKKPLEI